MAVKPYLYPTKRRRKTQVADVRLPVADSTSEEETQVGLIQGKTPTSLEEWRVAVALWTLKIDFAYQVPILGGRTFLGGYVVDFVVYLPFAIPLEVQGEHWHEADLSAEERLRDAILEMEFGHPVVYVWGKDLQTQSDATAAVRKALMV